MKQKSEKPDYDVQFEKYGGNKRWAVCHPDYKKEIVVAAPAAEAAIVAFAEKHNRAWTEYTFYAFCNVREVKTKKS